MYDLCAAAAAADDGGGGRGGGGGGGGGGGRSCTSLKVSQCRCSDEAVCDKSAVIVEKLEGGFYSIQGYPPVHHSEKHKAWSTFQVSIIS